MAGKNQKKRQRAATRGVASPGATTRARSVNPETSSIAHTPSPRWVTLAVLAALVVAAAVAYFFVSRDLAAGTPTVVPTTPGQPALLTQARVIDGIPCWAEDVTYHEHAYLDISDRNNGVEVPQNVGIIGNRCLYWLHTHDNSGEIHMEAPKPRTFTLGNFFDIWGQPLSRSQAAGARVRAGESMLIFVNGLIYHGNPRSIVLVRHTQISIEIGPPFHRPTQFNFNGD